MCLKFRFAAALLLSATGVCVAGTPVVPTTTLAAQTVNNTSAANSFANQTNGNSGAANISKVDVHSLLYAGASTKIYAHLLLWFGGSNHMNVGYSSTNPNQIHNQITDMVSRGIDGVIIDWYGPNNSIDQATKLVMTEAESHPGFTFAIMIDQGAIEWYSCSGCSPQQALVNDLQYIQQTYFPSSAYMTLQGRPVVTNFNIDLSYTVDWNAALASLSAQPAFLFQNNNGFSHVLSEGSYSWVMPTTTDYGMSYLTSFYDAGMPLGNEQTVGAAYKGFNDSLASWGSNRIMGQQCGQTWLQTFSEVNSLYNSGKQLSSLQLVTWNDYEEATEIESGINNCVSVSASASGNSLNWSIQGSESTIDHYTAYISIDGENLMPLGETTAGTTSLNLCSYSIPNGNYIAYLQAVGKPNITNQISGAVPVSLNCSGNSTTSGTLTLGASPSTVSIAPGNSRKVAVTVTPSAGQFNSAVALACSGLPAGLTCSFAPSSVTPGSQSVSSMLTLVAAPVLAEDRDQASHFAFATFFGFGLFGITLIGRVRYQRAIATVGLLLIVGVVFGAMSCGGKTASSVKTTIPVPTSYVVTVNGDAGAVQLSTTVVVTVK